MQNTKEKDEMKFEGGLDFETGEGTPLTTRPSSPPQPSFRQDAEKFIRCRSHMPDTPILTMFPEAIYRHWNPNVPEPPDWVGAWLIETAEFASDVARKRDAEGNRTYIVHYPSAVTIFLDLCRRLAGATKKP